MKRQIILLTLSIVFTLPTFGQDDKRITEDGLGFSFIVPDGWEVNRKDIGFVMGSAQTEGFMLIYRGDFKKLADLKKAMNNGIEQEDGSKLMPAYDLTDLGDQGVAGMFTGTIDGTEVKGFLMALLPPSKKKAAVCLSVAPASTFNQSNMDQLKILLKSVIFD